MAAITYADKHTKARKAHGAVSGDATVRQYGLDGRRAYRKLWSSPGVKPAIETTGILVGATITTWYGTGVVTRVGTVAGWYMLRGRETRWDAHSVIEIHGTGVQA